jgi:hypothetical protein
MRRTKQRSTMQMCSRFQSARFISAKILCFLSRGEDALPVNLHEQASLPHISSCLRLCLSLPSLLWLVVSGGLSLSSLLLSACSFVPSSRVWTPGPTAVIAHPSFIAKKPTRGEEKGKRGSERPQQRSRRDRTRSEQGTTATSCG